MFTDKQVKFMKNIGLNLDFDNLTDDDYAEIEDKVADELQMKGFDINSEPTEIGLMCESILDNLE